MASGTRGTNTFQEGLRVILDDITALKTTPDADLQWIVQLETQVLQKIREPLDNQMRQQQAILQQIGGAGGSGTVLPGAQPPGAGPAGPPPFPVPNNVRQSPQIPTDAVTRFLGQRAPV
mgnify:CR=1 FL=1